MFFFCDRIAVKVLTTVKNHANLTILFEKRTFCALDSHYFAAELTNNMIKTKGD